MGKVTCAPAATAASRPCRRLSTRRCKITGLPPNASGVGIFTREFRHVIVQHQMAAVDLEIGVHDLVATGCGETRHLDCAKRLLVKIDGFGGVAYDDMGNKTLAFAHGVPPAGDNFRACAACLVKAHSGSVAPSLLPPDHSRECAVKILWIPAVCVSIPVQRFSSALQRASEKCSRTHFVQKKPSEGRPRGGGSQRRSCPRHPIAEEMR